MKNFYIRGKGRKKIDINRLKTLSNSLDFSTVVYCHTLEEDLDVPNEIKTAWKQYYDARQVFKKVLAKYDISL